MTNPNHRFKVGAQVKALNDRLACTVRGTIYEISEIRHHVNPDTDLFDFTALDLRKKTRTGWTEHTVTGQDLTRHFTVVFDDPRDARQDYVLRHGYPDFSGHLGFNYQAKRDEAIDAAIVEQERMDTVRGNYNPTRREKT